MVPAIVGAALTLGAIGWNRGSVSIVSVLVPIFVIVLGSADGLHLTSHIMDSLNSGAIRELGGSIPIYVVFPAEQELDPEPARAVLRLQNLDGTTLQEFQDLTSQIAHETGIQLQPVGTAFVMKEMNDQIIPQQLASLGPAAVLVFLLTALRYVATPVITNALGLAIGFIAMLFSPLQIHVTLSILMWVTMVTSAVLSLTFLPTITAGLWLSSPGD